jgi:hypothetical protein
MAALEVLALNTTTPQIMAPQSGDTYTFPRAVEMPLGTANGVLYLNGSKVVTSGSGLTFDGTSVFAAPRVRLNNANRLDWGDSGEWIAGDNGGAMLFGVDAAEQMRLTSTGLGIGTSSPTQKLEVNGVVSQTTQGTSSAQYRAVNSGGTFFYALDSSTGASFGAAYAAALWHSGNYPMVFATNNTERMRLDSSGNLGLGVTPSAWGSGFKSYDLTTISYSDLGVTRNAYWNGSAYVYRTTAAAAQYQMGSEGSHTWFTAPSGTAGNAISFTQAMTLDASGNLGIGTTSSPYTKLEVVGGDISTGGGAGAAQLGLELRGVALNAIPAAQVRGYIGVGNSGIGVAGDLLIAPRTDAVASIRFITGTTPTERLRIKSDGQLRFIPLAADPAGAENGDVYYNSSTNKLRLYAAGAWTDLN